MELKVGVEIEIETELEIGTENVIEGITRNRDR